MLHALDDDELLHVALDAMSAERHGEALSAVKLFLEREPGHAHGSYLLAALHAQLGMHQRAVEEYQAILAGAPHFALARFQLGQLQLLTGEPARAKQVLAPLGEQDGALAAYGRALCALVEDRTVDAARELSAGLALPQPDQAIAGRMRVLLGQLLSVASGPRARAANDQGTDSASSMDERPVQPEARGDGESRQGHDPLAQHLLLHGYGQLGMLGAGGDNASDAEGTAPRT